MLVPLIDRLEDQHNDGAVVVKDLVASFLVPEVERRRVQEQSQWWLPGVAVDCSVAHACVFAACS